MFYIDKRILNFLVIIALSFITFSWTFYIFHHPFELNIVLSVIAVRMLASLIIYKDYSLSWSKASQKTFLIKSLVYILAFFIYMPMFYTEIWVYFLASELFLYLFSINFLMYAYYYLTNKSHTVKTKQVVIYGAGQAGLKLMSEFSSTKYMVKYFVDDDSKLQNRSIDNTSVISTKKLTEIAQNTKFDLLVIAIAKLDKQKIKEIYNQFSPLFIEIKLLPSFDDILHAKDFSSQLKNISVEDLLARHPKDLDKTLVSEFIKNKIILISGAGGSIGSEICKQCENFGAKELILIDHSEYNLYQISQELKSILHHDILLSVVDKASLDDVFLKYKPDLVIHAAAYKHVPLVEANINEAIKNNVLGSKNIIDISIKHNVKKFILISTDKAVRPTNVMGTTKRITELYSQNIDSKNTEITAVRFGNVLDSSGSVIPKFKSQLQRGENLTVTHKDVTRFFMLVSEACSLVLQAGAIGQGGEVFILDMGEPIKIVDLAQKMIDLSSKENIKIEYIGLRTGEKLYEELMYDSSNAKTKYDSITVAQATEYEIKKLNQDMDELFSCKNKLKKLQEIVPEFKHQVN